MSQFELLRNVTIGQYIPTNSFIHRLDPRTKLAAAVIFIFAVSYSRSIIPCLVLFGTSLMIARLARIPTSYVMRGIRLGLPLLALVFTVQLFFQGWAEPAGRVFFEWGWIRITRYSLQLITIGLLRIICFIFITSLITMTSTTTELTHGIEKILHPFRRFGVPSHELALINMIALRFVPTFAEEMERVMKAQASRCADLDGNQKFWRPDKAAQAYLPLIVPLFINAFRRAEELVLAMEARCYIGGDGRTKFVVLKSTPRDYVALAVALAFFIFIVFTPWPAIRDVLSGLGVGQFL